VLPPVLEIYVVWHPADAAGVVVAHELVEHFHGTAFTGLIGGAIEVFIRSTGWRSDEDAPRPIPSDRRPLPNGIDQARFIVVVPLIGTEMAAAVEMTNSPWRHYISDVAAQQRSSDRIWIFPHVLDKGAFDQTELGRQLGSYQQIAQRPPDSDGDSLSAMRCRDLAQGIAQYLAGGPDQRLTIFISHTKRTLPGGEEDSTALIEAVRNVISATRLNDFFDANDLQPGGNWDIELRSKAATSAMLAIRTDLYPSREWCQREISIAKYSGMPVLIIDAIGHAEERGSFLMDHVPRVPVRLRNVGWCREDVYRALNLLVDECLKRVLWTHQEQLARAAQELGVTWWAPHAPEPLTLLQWMEDAMQCNTLPEDGKPIRVLHPDPPLGPDEKRVLDQALRLIRPGSTLDIMTPRLLAARGG
jgi:hypothetical protein